MAVMSLLGHARAHAHTCMPKWLTDYGCTLTWSS